MRENELGNERCNKDKEVNEHDDESGVDKGGADIHNRFKERAVIGSVISSIVEDSTESGGGDVN